MPMAALISTEAIFPKLRVTSKKQLLQELANRASHLTGVGERHIFDTLVARERLGSTGVGHGIAIPHGKVPELDRVYGFFARLERPLPFEAIDEQPVDLVFLLLAPDTANAEHLKALSRVSRMLRDEKMCEKLRGCESAEGLYALLTQGIGSYAA